MKFAHQPRARFPCILFVELLSTPVSEVSFLLLSHFGSFQLANLELSSPPRLHLFYIVIFPAFGPTVFVASPVVTTPTGPAPSIPFATTPLVSSGIFFAEQSKVRRSILLTLEDYA